MTARKCKVCGVRPGTNETWCERCDRAFDGLIDAMGRVDAGKAAEWGAKRRAAAAKKAGGK